MKDLVRKNFVSIHKLQHITDVGIVARILMAPTFDDRTQKIPLMDTIIEKVSHNLTCR